MSLEISSLCFMHVYSSDPLSYASMCISMRLPPSFHGSLLGKISFLFQPQIGCERVKITIRSSCIDNILHVYTHILHVLVHHRLPLF